MTAFCGLARFASGGGGISSLIFIPQGVGAAVGSRQDCCSLAYVLAVGLVILDVSVAVAVLIIDVLGAMAVSFADVVGTWAVKTYGSTVGISMVLPPGVVATAGCRQSL